MPCGNPDHEHPAWPQQGQHELMIEACENHCGWCEYKTKSANNLRVHAKRHVANKRETRLRRITVFKGKAGRKRVQMTRPRFPLPKAHEEKEVRSEAADSLGDPIQGHESESNNNTEHEMSDPSFASRSDYPRQDFLNQILSVTPARSASSDQRSDKANHAEPNLPWPGSERLNSNSKFLFLLADTKAIQASKSSIEQNPGYKVTSTTNKIVAWPLRRGSVESENRARETCQADEQDTYEIYHDSDDVCPNSRERSWSMEHSNFRRPKAISQVVPPQILSSTAQARSTELQKWGSTLPNQPNLQAVNYPRGGPTSPNLLGTVSPSGANSDASQATSKEQSQTELDAELSYHSIILQKEIEEYLSKKPHREESKALVQHVFGVIGSFGSSSGFDIKFLRHLTTKALEIAKSDISYLRFSNALLRCIRKIDQSNLFGAFTPFISNRYFAEALAHIQEGVEHLSNKSTYLSPEKGYLCNHEDCPGIALATIFGLPSLNLPKGYYKVHLQYYHNEDVGFTEDKDIMGCSIRYSYWYCSECLFQVWRSTQACQKRVCPGCHLACEQNRIKARQKLYSAIWADDAGLDNILPSPFDRTGPLERTTSMTDSSILIASDTTQQLLPAASTLPTVIAGPSRP